MSEPDFIYQTRARGMEPWQKMDWIHRQARKASDQGATFHRTTSHECGALLYEGWKVRPEDKGKPRWNFRRKDTE